MKFEMPWMSWAATYDGKDKYYEIITKICLLIEMFLNNYNYDWQKGTHNCLVCTLYYSKHNILYT